MNYRIKCDNCGRTKNYELLDVTMSSDDDIWLLCKDCGMPMDAPQKLIDALPDYDMDDHADIQRKDTV